MENTEGLLLEKDNYIDLFNKSVHINDILDLIRIQKMSGGKGLMVYCKNMEDRCDIKKELESLGYTTTCKIQRCSNEKSSFERLYLQINW